MREATEPTGHAVRQLYLAAGVTDVYLETRRRLAAGRHGGASGSLLATKTYITGAHGSRHRDEAFGDPYELPPDRAYAETCAAIASFQWNWRMLLATGRGRYADEMERVLYNAIAGATSLDGRPLLLLQPAAPARRARRLRRGLARRSAWTGTAAPCCPPNLARLVASLHAYVATSDDGGLQLHLLSAADVSADVAGGPVRLRVRTAYPWEETASIVVDSDHEWTLSLRVPGWCREARLSVAGEPVAVSPDADGYVRVRRAWRPGTQLLLTLPMPPRVLAAHPRVDAVRGCVAWARGPIVYCLEQHDQPAGVALEDIRVASQSAPRAVPGAGVPGVPVVLVGQGYVERADGRGLYAVTTPAAPNGEAIEVTAIPYFRWANRGPAPMRVWIPAS